MDDPALLDSLRSGVERHRALRREIEQSILPLASSVDGRRFSLQASLEGFTLQAGGYVVLEGQGAPRLGQVITLTLTEHEGPELRLADGDTGGDALGLTNRMVIRLARGTGAVIDGESAPFHDLLARPATPTEVAEWLERIRPGRARLPVGDLILAPGVPCELDAGGFDRHTFLCGQSGSGKTYALGVVLEQLLLETDLRIVVLDPNSDFTRLSTLRGDVDDAVAARYGPIAEGIEVHGAGDSAQAPLRLRYTDLDPAAQAAALRLDPIGDREEYAELIALVEASSGGRLLAPDELAREGGDEGRALARRARNLGVDRWSVWGNGSATTVADAVRRSDTRCLVVDVGSLPTRDEAAAVAATVLSTLWAERSRREPVLVVVDEAHNVCPSRPEEALTALATEHAVRIAGEGRKFGLYLLVATQRPQKVHENVLSQCDNLILMRMNSTADLGFVGDAFSFVPQTLLEQAVSFGLGESLVAGKLAPRPALVRIGGRITAEGGSDVPADWARRR